MDIYSFFKKIIQEICTRAIHLDKPSIKVCRYHVHWISVGFPGRLELPHTSFFGEGKGDINPSRRDKNEFFADSQAFHFPMNNCFLIEEQRKTIPERECLSTATQSQIKQSICSNPLKVSHIVLHTLLWLAADTVSPM